MDEYTAVLMDADGSASVVGPGAAWLLRLDAGDVRRCVPGEPFSHRTDRVLEVQRGDAMDLATFTGTGTTSLGSRARRHPHLGIVTSQSRRPHPGPPGSVGYRR